MCVQILPLTNTIMNFFKCVNKDIIIIIVIPCILFIISDLFHKFILNLEYM